MSLRRSAIGGPTPLRGLGGGTGLFRFACTSYGSLDRLVLPAGYRSDLREREAGVGEHDLRAPGISAVKALIAVRDLQREHGPQERFARGFGSCLVAHVLLIPRGLLTCSAQASHAIRMPAKENIYFAGKVFRIDTHFAATAGDVGKQA
jgi:hypothetical protein